MSSTSVRPITTSEMTHGQGQPLMSYMLFFGVTNGILAHMNFYKLSVNSKTWFPTTHSKVMALVFIGGSTVAYHLAGEHMFSNPELQRLKESHDQDNYFKTWAYSSSVYK